MQSAKFQATEARRIEFLRVIFHFGLKSPRAPRFDSVRGDFLYRLFEQIISQAHRNSITESNTVELPLPLMTHKTPRENSIYLSTEQLRFFYRRLLFRCNINYRPGPV